MSAPLRVVLDTNIVLSALVFGGGAAGRLRVAWQQGAVLPLASTATVQELVRVLAYPKFRHGRERLHLRRPHDGVAHQAGEEDQGWFHQK